MNLLKILFNLNYIIGIISIDHTLFGYKYDDNTCLESAGYSWCESSQNCIRMWETPCEDNYSNCRDCLNKQQHGVNIACPEECNMVHINCNDNTDCGELYFCRPITNSPNSLKECVRYLNEGDSCGGFTTPNYESRCKHNLECVHSKSNFRPSVPMIADTPGHCKPFCNSGTNRDEYGNCVRPTHILEGVHQNDVEINNCNRECPPLIPCPSPGPDCSYIPPELDDCGCITGCGEITCYPMSQSITPVCSEVLCMMYCENGNQIDENGCNICACNDIILEINTEEVCPILFEPCDNDFVCPMVREITHCSEGGIVGTTTYQLSLIIMDENIKNIYAIFGNSINDGYQMIIPSAYQVKNSFRSNIGGVSYDILSISPNSRYDSWLTIGVTDGDQDNQLGTIGIDFDSWDLNSPLIVNNGAVFSMNSDYSLNGLTEVVVGQLTIPSTISTQAIINVQGKLKYSENTWKQNNVMFSLNPPINNQNNHLINCEIWYDGCNTCQVNNGIIGSCTRIMCFREDEPRCLRLMNGH